MTRERRREEGRGAAAWGGVLALVLGTIAWAGGPGAAAAWADDCDDCPAPAEEALRALAGYTLETRDGELDYVEIDGGECGVRFPNPPRYSQGAGYWVLRGTGMVWDCPHSSCCDSISAEASAEDSTQWTSTQGLGGEFSLLGLKIGTSLQQAVSQGFHVRVVTRVEKKICAKFCHRIRWSAYFHVVEFKCEIDWEIVRRFAWWTKNEETGATVHQKGDVYVVCRAGTAEFGRMAPIDVSIRLEASACPDAEECEPVETKDLGFYPPLTPTPPPVVPPPPLPPVTTESDDPVVTEPAKSGEADEDVRDLDLPFYEVDLGEDEPVVAGSADGDSGADEGSGLPGETK